MSKSLTDFRQGKEFVHYAEKKGAEIRQNGGSHAVVKTRLGACVVPVHPGDLGKGLRLKIVKVFLTIGLALAGVMLAAAW